MMRARVLLLLSLPALVTCLQCYTCDGKKGLCSSGADPGDKTTCPSVFSLIRPSVMLALDEKFTATSGNRTDKILKDVLISTFSGMFTDIPNLAVSKAQSFISDPPSKDDLSMLNSKVFSYMEKDCKELGCTFTSHLKTNISELEERYDEKFAEKVNNDTLTREARSVLSDVWEHVYGNGSLEFTLNVTLDTSKDEVSAEVERVIAAVDADCSADPCSFTADIKTAATEMVEANFTDLFVNKSAEAVNNALSSAFVDFESRLSTGSGASPAITVNTTLDEMKTMITSYWAEINSNCGGDCTGGSSALADTITVMEANFTENSTELEKLSIGGTASLTLAVELNNYFRTKANESLATKTLTETSSFTDLSSAVDEVIAAVNTPCTVADCLDSVDIHNKKCK